MPEAGAQTRPRAGDPSEEQWLRRRLECLIGVPATEGNALRVLRNGDEIFPAMLDAIRAAENTVDFMTFIYWRGDIAEEFARTVAERARAGVRCRILIDAIGGRLIDKDLLRVMRRDGVLVEWFRTPWIKSPFKQNHRCHRKVLLVDESVAFTGGVGIAEEWCGNARDEREWRDTHIELRGPAMDGLSAAFSQNWAESGNALDDDRHRYPEQPQPGRSVVQVVRGSASIGWDDMQTTFRLMIESARERLHITTAYFAPDSYFLQLLCDAADRGVDVQLLLPGPHTDKRYVQLASESVYEQLVSHGVHISTFQPSMLHAKVLTFDGLAAVVGSSNLNRRSMDHDEEVVLCVLDREVVGVLDQHFAEDLERSIEIDLTRWRDRSAGQRLLEAAVQPARRWF